MEDLPLGRIAALVPEFAAKELPLGRTLMIMMEDAANVVYPWLNKHYIGRTYSDSHD